MLEQTWKQLQHRTNYHEISFCFSENYRRRYQRTQGKHQTTTWNEIQQRILDRLLNIGSYNDPDIQLQAKLDNLRLMKLEEEENQMQELLKLNKKGKIKWN